jgi:UPF0716 protein FxsA
MVRPMGILRYIFPAFFILEVASLIAVGSWLGFGWTFLLLLATFIAGVVLVRNMGAEVMGLLRRGQLQTQDIAAALPKAHLRLLAGLLLIIPGFASDILALVALLPPVQAYASKLMRGWLERNAPRPQGGVVIEGEAVEVEISPSRLDAPDTDQRG